MTALQQQGQAAKAATYVLATAGTARKNAALNAIADVLTERQTEWLSANAEDVAAAKEAGMRPAMLDRLTLTPERVAGIVDGVRQVAALPDPIGRVDKMETRPNGLIIGRRRVPLGVIAIIFEARPNVTVDAAALCHGGRVRYGHHQRQPDGRPVRHRGGEGHWNAICIGEN